MILKCLLSVILFFTALTVVAQDDITICHSSATERFAVLASTENFKLQHQLPKEYIHVSQQGGKMISFKCPDGTDAKGYFLQAKSKSDKWIFVFQEWWGLNDNIKKESEDLYNSLGNVNVLALDMYDGQVTADREVASRIMQQFKQERGDMIVKGALAYAGTDAKVGTIGWCFGGAQSLQAAITAGKQAVACVIYYGMPVDDVQKLKSLNTDVLGIFGTRDKGISPEVVKKFEANMKAAGKKVEVNNYDAEHGFANPSNRIYDEKATKDAKQKTLTYFRERLK